MEYSITPSSFFVGDRAKFIVQLDAFHKINRSSFDIDKLEKSDSLTINDISIGSVEGITCLVINFTPWQTGKVDFPSLKNIGIDIELPTITVPSILEVEGVPQSLQDARGPILLDGTAFMIYKGISITVLLLLFLTFFLVWVKKKGRAFLTRLSNNYALCLFGLNLRILKRKLKKIESFVPLEPAYELLAKKLKEEKFVMRNAWGKTYESALRKCLASIYKKKVNINWASLTYSEMQDMIASELKSSEPQEDCLQNIRTIFRHLSYIRFAKENVSEKGVNVTSLENELLDLSFKFLGLNKKRKPTNSKKESSKC